MTFNEGMQIDTSTTSSGGGGRGMAIGGGVAGLVILVVALLLGADPGEVLSQQPVDQGQYTAPGFDLDKCRTGEDANKYVQCRVVATANSVDAVWSDLLNGYTRPQVQLFRGQTSTACGAATSAVGPFYCPADQTAYFDTDFFDVLVDRFGSSSGPLAQEYVVAHEFGHHVQNLLGVLGRAQTGAQGATGAGVRTELQADCYAGMWVGDATETLDPDTGKPFLNPISQEQLQNALSAAAAVGDDHIQKRGGGDVNPDAFTHGTSEQRERWFTTGYQQGTLEACDTFAASSL